MSKLLLTAVGTMLLISAIAGGAVKAAPAQTSEFVTEIIPIRYALASELAEFISTVATNNPTVRGSGSESGSRTNTPQRGRLASASAFTGRALKVVRTAAPGDFTISSNLAVNVDERSNALLVTGTAADLARVKTIISNYDVTLPQVLVEAAVIEIPLKGRGEIWRAAGGGVPQELAAFASGLTGRIFEVEPAPSREPAGGEGWRYAAMLGLDVDGAIRRLRGNARILQRPRIQTSDGVAATLFVGETKPGFQGGSAYTCGYPPASIDTLRTGITLEVLPVFTADGSVLLDIKQQLDRVTGVVTIQNVGDVPVTEATKAQAKLEIKDRATMLLGGLTSTNRESIFHEVGWVKRIPWIGGTLNHVILSPKHSVRSELVLLIRPVMLPAEIATRQSEGASHFP